MDKDWGQVRIVLFTFSFVFLMSISLFAFVSKPFLRREKVRYIKAVG